MKASVDPRAATSERRVGSSDFIYASWNGGAFFPALPFDKTPERIVDGWIHLAHRHYLEYAESYVAPCLLDVEHQSGCSHCGCCVWSAGLDRVQLGQQPIAGMESRVRCRARARDGGGSAGGRHDRDALVFTTLGNLDQARG